MRAMPLTRSVLPLATLVCAVLAILALLQPPLLPRELGWLFKPLTTVLILAWAWPRGADQPRLRPWVRAGLALSLLGDVCLLWPQTGFVPGLASFLLAHLCYIAGFARMLPLGRIRWPFLMFGLIAAVVLGRLWPAVPAELRAPVLVYVLALASMAAQAWGWWRASVRAGAADEPLARWAAWGGTLFLLSDALLAINKFAGPLPLASLWVLASYWPAQWCIASSLRR
jgi:uncharacterized membrane protein YhhN